MLASIFMPMFLATAIASAVEENKRFHESIAGLSDEDRAAAIAKRHQEAVKRNEENRIERERKELLEAMKPHTLWSFLGLSRK
jgi:hypothetical protein